ncbi:MAG: RNA polymerase sigma factor [Bacteroidia bacterium]
MSQEKHHTEFMELYKLHHTALSNYCRVLINNTDDAKDLMSESILACLNNFEKLKDRSKFKFYLFGIASRLLKRKIYKSGLFNGYKQKQLVNNYAKADILDRTELYVFKKMLNRLPENQREIFVLFEINDLSLNEISEIENIPLSTVKTRLSRARQALAEIYKDEQIILN